MSFASAHADYLDPDKHLYHEYDDREYCDICEEELTALPTHHNGRKVCSQCYTRVIVANLVADPLNQASPQQYKHITDAR